MITAFCVHGKTKISIEENIIVIQSEGPWNNEYFKTLHQEILLAVSRLNTDHYGVLLLPIGETISVAEALDYHMDFLKQGNVKAIAINLENSHIPNTTERLCRKVYEQIGINFQFFSSNDSAKEWLKTTLS